jgi:hypothetical protein
MQKLGDFDAVLLNESDDSFPVVFWNVLRLVFANF